jgi:hypothetical protein
LPSFKFCNIIPKSTNDHTTPTPIFIIERIINIIVNTHSQDTLQINESINKNRIIKIYNNGKHNINFPLITTNLFIYYNVINYYDRNHYIPLSKRKLYSFIFCHAKLFNFLHIKRLFQNT